MISKNIEKSLFFYSKSRISVIKWGVMDKQKSSKGIIAVIVAAVAVIIALVAAIVFFLVSSEKGAAEDNTLMTQTDVTDEADAALIQTIEEAGAAEEEDARPEGWYGSFASSGIPDRKTDLGTYTDRCPDVYALIDIPGTDIDEPIAYCEDATDPFYFTHDIDGNPSEKGMIITDSMNAGDFSDPLTLVYGQDPDDGTLFSQLHRFRDTDFFNDHDKIDIYLDDAELVYEIYACYIGSSDHILLGNDFKDPIGFMSFFDSVGEIRDLSMNIRESAKPVLGDHVIALVTHCGDESKRLFVFATLEEVKYK